MAWIRYGLLAAAILFAIDNGRAQVPDGWYVLSYTGTAAFGSGGIAVMSPRTGAPAIPLIHATGLPAELTGLGGNYSGACGVAIDRASGNIFVGETAAPGTSIELHRVQLTVAGNAAVATVVGTTLVGIVGNQESFGGIRGLATLPDGDILLALRNVSGPPLNGERLARFRPSTGTLQAIVTTAVAGNIETVAYDASNATIVFHVQVPAMGPIQGYLYRCPVAGGIAQNLRQTGAPRSMVFDGAHRILGCNSAEIFTMDANGILLSSVRSNSNLVGLALERATNLPVSFGSDLQNINDSGVFLGPNLTRLTTASVPWTGSGIAVQDDPVPYGTGSAIDPSYTWKLPQRSGMPLPGNSAFTLQVIASDGTTPVGFLCASPLPGDAPVLGVTALIDINSLFVWGTITAGSPMPLPIPATVPAGLQLCFQSVFLDAAMPAGITTSEALRVGTIR